MIVKYSPAFFKRLKKVDVRIKRKVKEKILLFLKNPHNPQLNNHLLKREYEGHRSINITSDWRALYREFQEGRDTVAYFVTLGTHKQLYKQRKNLGSLN
jgi:addiction module RelE/StbE family toxin